MSSKFRDLKKKYFVGVLKPRAHRKYRTKLYAYYKNIVMNIIISIESTMPV